MAEENVEPRIVEGTMIASSHGGLGRDKVRSKVISEAMEQAILKCHEEGNLDPDYMRGKIQEARDTVIKELNDHANAVSLEITRKMAAGEPV